MNLTDLHNKIINIFDNEHFNNNNFDNFITILKNKNNIELFYLYFKHLEPNNTIVSMNNTKIFLTIYTFIFYPEVMNLNKDFKINQEIINLSNILNILFRSSLKQTKNKNTNLITYFFKKYREYLKLFNDWKKLDLEAIYFNLAKTLYELENDFNTILNQKKKNSQNEELLNLTRNNIENEKKRIFKKATKLNKDEGKFKVINYYNYIKYNSKPLNEKHFTKTLLSELETNVRKAYWDIFEFDLSFTPPKTNNLVSKLKELKHLIFICIPNRNDIHNDVNNNIDIEFLEHKIKSDVFDHIELKKYVDYLFSLLKKLQSEDEDENTLHFENKINDMITNKIPIPLILRKFMEFLFTKLEYIYTQKEIFLKKINKK